MIFIDGTGAIAGRLASYAAKQALKGEEISIMNVEKVVITGNKTFIQEKFIRSRGRVGSGQSGPKVSKSPEKIVKRMVRGMIPQHRFGRGKEALKRVKCYVGVPKEFEGEKLISAGKPKKTKVVKVGEILN